jgi:NTE family protein
MTSPLTPTAKRVFLVLEGGGAKGIVHVGALRALEGRDVKIAGVAGTSAGAIVSALVAAGYSSHELIDADGGSPVLRAIGLEHATDFFGRAWTRLAIASWASSDMLVAVFLALLPCAAVAAAAMVWLGASFPWALILFLAAAAGLGILPANRLSRGLSQLDLMVEKLELALSRKLGLVDGERVLFRHFDAVGRPLRIVATDLAARRLKLFSSSETPVVRVAEAVAASAALPIACGHRVIEGRKYIDGGIVSNLPAWTFDEERALDPDAVTVAISIDDGRLLPSDVDIGPYRIFLSIMFAAMFGRRHLEIRAAPRLLTLNLRTDIGVVDFDLDREHVLSAVDDACRAAEARISERLFNLPKRFDEACEKVREQIDGRLVPGPPGIVPRTRVLVALRDLGAVASWRIQYGCGFLPSDADDQLLLPEDASIVGHAVLSGGPLLQAKPFGADVGLEGPINRYRRALVRGDLEWCLAIPIYPRGSDGDADPLAVVAIDSDVNVRYFRFDEDVVETLAEAAEVLILPVVESALELR